VHASSSQLVWNAYAKEAGNQLGGKVTTSQLLTHLYEWRLLGGDWANMGKIILKQNFSEPSLACYTMELCKYVATADERESLIAYGLSQIELNNRMLEIENKSFRELWILEGSDPDLEEQLESKKKGNQRKKKTYVAVGRRVMQFKKNILVSTNSELRSATPISTNDNIDTRMSLDTHLTKRDRSMFLVVGRKAT